VFPYIWLWTQKLFTKDHEFSFDTKLEDPFYDLTSYYHSSSKPMAKHIMGLYTIQNLIIHKSSHLHFIFAVTLILKHATLLRLSNLPNLALSCADLDYQKANIDVAIQQHLIACAPEPSVEQFACFIMGTDIVHQPTQSG